MSARIPDTHAEAWAMLPWLANGRIPPADREWVEAHVQGCADCRAELAAQRRIAASLQLEQSAPRTSDDGSGEQPSFNTFGARIEAAEAATLPGSGNATDTVPAARGGRTVRWLAAAVVVQAICLGVLGFALNSTRGGSEFRTVSDPEPRLAAPAVRIVFAPDANITTINTLLTHQGLTIVSGPGRSDNFTAELSADAIASGATAQSVADVIARDPSVTLAQPVAR